MPIQEGQTVPSVVFKARVRDESIGNSIGIISLLMWNVS